MTETRVFIADEDERTRSFLHRSLEGLGYLVVGEADTTSATIDMAKQLVPDVILAHVNPPKIDGVMVAQTLRTDAFETVAPVILMVSAQQQDWATQVKQAGALGYLFKPIKESEIVPIIEIALARWEEKRTRRQELSELKEQLESRTIIERAKGHLMDTYGLREAEAFRKIQRLAMNNRKPMREVAQAILLAQQI
jgi:response regulator NasT